MVTAAVLGHRGYLGSVVARRWAEKGADVRTVAVDVEYVVNCIRPDNLLLSERLAETTRLIQPSTDAIREDSNYAVGKRLLERLPAVTIRAGIIDLRHDYGHANWTCNPITPLEWADLAWDLRDRPGIHVAGRETVSRWQVVTTVAAIWGRPLPAPTEAPEARDRVQHDAVRSWNRLADALGEFHTWLG